MEQPPLQVGGHHQISRRAEAWLCTYTTQAPFSLLEKHQEMQKQCSEDKIFKIKVTK